MSLSTTTTESKQAAAGWGGDRFALYETGKPDEMFVAQLTAWDTPQDAKEFFDAYAKRTAKRYPDAKRVEVDECKRRAHQMEDCDGGVARWSCVALASLYLKDSCKDRSEQRCFANDDW